MTQVNDFYTVPDNMHNDSYFQLEQNTYDFHPTQHLFRPAANNALLPRNGLRCDQEAPQCSQLTHNEMPPWHYEI